MVNKPWYPSAYWQNVFAFNHLDDFAAIWNLQINRVEPGNERRGGWSYVALHTLKLPEGGTVDVYIKRQQNHLCRSILPTIVKGRPTFLREFKNLQRLNKANVAVPEILYFEQRAKNNQVILILRALDQYISLDKLQAQHISFALKRKISASIAETVRRLHQSHLHHNCLFEKHIFIRYDNNLHCPIHVVLIDLEKAKLSCSRIRNMWQDLSKMHRRQQGWSNTDMLRFYKDYRGKGKLNFFDRVSIKYFQWKNKKRYILL